MFVQAKLLFLYTETPLHVGSGSSLGTVDLPIQRERHTNLPMIQSTGIKGKLRHVLSSNGLASHPEVIEVIFGPEGDKASDHAGALSPGDARLLLFPVRSLAGVFAWITCPLVLGRLQRDVNIGYPSLEALNYEIPNPASDRAYICANSQLTIDQAVVLEEFSFTAETKTEVTDLAASLAEYALPPGEEYSYWRQKLKKDLVIVHDDVFQDFCRFSTDVVSRTKLNNLTKIVEPGALWTEENLPADALLYTPLFASNPRTAEIPEDIPDAAAILNLVQSQLTTTHQRLQLGGNETVGRGIVATRILNVQEN